MSPDLSVKTISVTGVITISENREGSSGTYGVGGIKVMLGEDEVAESAADGSFTAEVPKGTTELTLKGETTVNRTVTLTGESDITDVNIPIIVCNYEASDNVINITDAGLFLDYIGTDYAYTNLEGSDNVVNITDGYIEITAEEDGIDTENPDIADEAGTETPDASVNITGGELVIEAGGSAVDSDGNINLIGGSMSIDSEGACVDYIDDLYISDDFELDCKCDNSEAQVWVEQTVCIDTPAPDVAEDVAENDQAEGVSDSASDDTVDDGLEDGAFESPDIEND